MKAVDDKLTSLTNCLQNRRTSVDCVVAAADSAVDPVASSSESGRHTLLACPISHRGLGRTGRRPTLLDSENCIRPIMVPTATLPPFFTVFVRWIDSTENRGYGYSVECSAGSRASSPMQTIRLPRRW